MRKKTLFWVLLFSVALALPAGAKTLKFAFQGSLDSFHPYNLNKTFHLGFQGNIYDGLIRRGPNLEIEPALAERWEVMEPARWRFYLRKGVKFHDGTPFTADDVVFSATRVAVLLSGQVDMAYPIPVQDMKRVDGNASIRMLVGPELRTIFLGMDQFRDELLYSSVKGKNPFKDKRVRQAFYQAIDTEAIKKKVMRGLSEPSAMMIAPGVHGGGNPKFKRLEYDPAASKKLLAEAGYPDGFEVGMDCPNDRYVNDEQICLAAVSMRAKVGIIVNLLAQTDFKESLL
jgi:ABC-type transport system substrate-binding protein